MKTPQECASLDDVRAMIDSIDAELLGMLARRREYVLAAARFKQSASDVRAPARYAAVLEQRRQWAEALDFDPDVVEQIFRTLIDYFIAEEMRAFHEAGDAAA